MPRVARRLLDVRELNRHHAIRGSDVVNDAMDAMPPEMIDHIDTATDSEVL